MAQPLVTPPEETDRRIRLTHHLVELGDGHEVGISVGGQGVPLVFLHGLGLNRRAYLRMLSRAAGLGFLVIAVDDVIPALARSPRLAVQTIGLAAYDAQRDPSRLSGAEHRRYVRMLASVAMRNARQPTGFTGAARAILQSGDYTPLLHVMRDQQIPTIVVHGEKDLLVPFDSARDLAEDADATLYRVPGAYHSWMIANPRHGADALRQLLNGELGEALRDAAAVLGVKDWRDTAAWDQALIDPEARVRELNGDQIEELGDDEPEHVEMELVRSAQRPLDAPPMPWLRRTYRRWASRRPGRLDHTRS